jgi:hypothetical protein
VVAHGFIGMATGAVQQPERFTKRQSDDVAVGAIDEPDKRFRTALNCIATCFSDSFFAGDVTSHFASGQPLECHARYQSAQSQFSFR